VDPGTVKSALSEAIAVTLLVTETLDRLGVEYVVGGSVASSVHGLPRSTADSDIVAALREDHVVGLATSLEGAFYVDESMIRDAIRRRFEFNVLHLATMFKVDVFVPALDAVTRRELSRGSRVDVGSGKSFIVATAEDTIAQKLRWFQLGGGVSERQWSDALGVVRVRGPALDREYLRETSDALGVATLLERLLREA
jgi:hypothetical protein